MIKLKGKPITGTNTAMKPKPPAKSTGNTSSDGERQVLQPPQPFANKKGTVNVPVEPVAPGTLPVSNIPAGKKGHKIGHMALPKARDVGQTRPIDHSGNVFGRFGTSHPKRKGAQNLGASRKNASFYGD